MKKPDYFNKTIAEKLGYEVKLVKEVNGFYWKEIKKLLSHADYNAIFLKNLGTMATSRNKLRKEISRQILIIRKFRKIENLGIKRTAILEAKIENLKKLLIRRDELAKFYLENKRCWIKPK